MFRINAYQRNRTSVRCRKPSSRTAVKSTLYRSVRKLASCRKEIKAVDFNAFTYFDNVALSNTSVLPCNTISQGTDGYQRVGRRVFAKSFEFSYTIQPYILPALASRFKVAIVRDKHPTGSLPLFSDIFQSVDRLGAIISDPESLINLATRDRFSLMYHRMHSMGTVTAAGAQIDQTQNNPDVSGRMRKRLNFTVNFKGATSTLGDCEGNAFYIIAFNGDSAATSLSWSLHFQTRFSYTD